VLKGLPIRKRAKPLLDSQKQDPDPVSQEEPATAPDPPRETKLTPGECSIGEATRESEVDSAPQVQLPDDPDADIGSSTLAANLDGLEPGEKLLDGGN